MAYGGRNPFGIETDEFELGPWERSPGSNVMASPKPPDQGMGPTVQSTNVAPSVQQPEMQAPNVGSGGSNSGNLAKKVATNTTLGAVGGPWGAAIAAGATLLQGLFEAHAAKKRELRQQAAEREMLGLKSQMTAAQNLSQSEQEALRNIILGTQAAINRV